MYGHALRRAFSGARICTSKYAAQRVQLHPIHRTDAAYRHVARRFTDGFACHQLAPARQPGAFFKSGCDARPALFLVILLGQVLTNFRQQLSWAVWFCHVFIAARCPRFLFLPTKRIGSNREDRDRTQCRIGFDPARRLVTVHDRHDCHFSPGSLPFHRHWDLQPPRHISTLPIATALLRSCNRRDEPDLPIGA